MSTDIGAVVVDRLIIIRETEADAVQERQASALRLAIRFLERPVVKEALRSRVLRRAEQLPVFGWSKVLAGDTEDVGGAIDILDVDTDRGFARDGDGDEAGGVRDVEDQPAFGPAFSHLGPAVPIDLEPPCSGRDRRIAGERGAQQRAGDNEAV